MTMFRKAERKDSKLRMALIDPSGSGKTMTALKVASSLGGPVAVIDTERGSASKYSGEGLFDFDVLELESFAPERYVEGIKAAADAGYAVLVIDSLSHAWSGKDGLLEFVDKEAARSKSGSSFGAWRNATPKHNMLVDAILGAKLHVIVTMRAKTEYVQEKDERGKTTVRKVGLAPVQRDGLEYEFDVVGDLDTDNNLVVTKSRCPALTGGVFNRAGADVAGLLKGWLTGSAPAAASAQPPTPAPPPAPNADAITASQITALSIALKEAGFKTDEDSKAQGRAFLAYLVGASGLGSVKDLTKGQTQRALDQLGSGDNGSYKTDRAKVNAAFQRYADHRAGQEADAQPTTVNA